tara:strand:- start:185 stop:466 length:282 start_codon:yes stop_codon:yes gene_type:complete
MDEAVRGEKDEVIKIFPWSTYEDSPVGYVGTPKNGPIIRVPSNFNIITAAPVNESVTWRTSRSVRGHNVCPCIIPLSLIIASLWIDTKLINYG